MLEIFFGNFEKQQQKKWLEKNSHKVNGGKP
jgi:hypothetical protein